jgi:cation-transporting ATPase E
MAGCSTTVASPSESTAVVLDDDRGLSDAEVRERVADGRHNNVPAAPVRTLGEIFRANVFTRVNAIIGALFVLILVVGRPKDSVFAAVIVSNAVIGIVQELRARKTLNELALLNAPKARVVREGKAFSVGVEEVVADDLLELRSGFQVVVDGTVTRADGLEVDESLLTGESEPVHKDVGNEVLSGSFVSAGSGRYRAVHIGADSYSSKLAAEARQFSLAPSELRRSIDTVLRWQLIIIPPAAILLLFRLWNSDEVRRLSGGDHWREAITGVVAACVAMVPSGLVLLTSIALVAGALGLARRRALTKELASVELLARVDTLCLDKTGTITTGDISLAEVVTVDGFEDAFVAEVLGAIAAADPEPNATLAPIAAGYEDPGWSLQASQPFSSARKWASAAFAERGVFFIGAPEILLEDDDPMRERVTAEAANGRRVIAVVHAHESGADPATDVASVPSRRDAVALVLLEDVIRPDASETLEYFRSQGITLKVISGDNPTTVSAVAARAGVPDADQVYDARQLPTDVSALADVLDKYTVFGRVTPQQKREMVGALQSRGHVVAMTGDGVNDVLALKDADMGIAMGSGSPAARAVAQLVLLDNAYSTLPHVLAEGRRVINNIERVANLFLTKSVYAVLLTVLTGITGAPYPFLPRHFTLIDWFSIGLPGLFLALAPSAERVQPHFLRRVLAFSVPAGVSAAAATYVVYAFARSGDHDTLVEARTAATITLLALGLVVLVVASRPFKVWKITLAATMAGFYAAVLAVGPLRRYFELDVPSSGTWVAIVLCSAAGAAGIALLPPIVARRFSASVESSAGV